MAKPSQTMWALSEGDLRRRHDALGAHTGIGPQHYQQELARRDLERWPAAVLALTRRAAISTAAVLRRGLALLASRRRGH
jgi:hypothetical protein